MCHFDRESWSTLFQSAEEISTIDGFSSYLTDSLSSQMLNEAVESFDALLVGDEHRLEDEYRNIWSPVGPGFDWEDMKLYANFIASVFTVHVDAATSLREWLDSECMWSFVGATEWCAEDYCKKVGRICIAGLGLLGATGAAMWVMREHLRKAAGWLYRNVYVPYAQWGPTFWTFIIRCTRTVDPAWHQRLIRIRSFKFDEAPDKPLTHAHSHPDAWKARDIASASINRFCTAEVTPEIGDKVPVYDCSLAIRDIKFIGGQGRRFCYSPQDTDQTLGFRPIPNDPSTIVILKDQDWYVEDWSEYFGLTIAIYTMIPDGLSGNGPDSVYYFDSMNSFVERITGGATYHGRMHEYCKDLVVIEDSSRGKFCVYNVEKFLQPGTTNRYVVFLQPKSIMHIGLLRFQKCALYFTGVEFKANMFERIEHVAEEGDFLVGNYNKGGIPYKVIKMTVATAADSAVWIKEEVYFSLRYFARKETKSWQISEVHRYLKEWDQEITRIQAVTLCRYFDVAPPDSDSVANYQFLPSQEQDYPLKTGAAASKAGPAMSNTHSVCVQDEAAQDEYVEKRQKANENNVVPEQETVYDGYIAEFIALCLGDNVGKGVVAPLEQVLSEQTAAPQKARNKKERDHLPRQNVGRLALKKEANVPGKPPRGITTMSTDHTWLTGRVMRGFKSVLNKCNWYMVGLSPTKVAKRIQFLSKHVAADLGHMDTDYSKMDETISLWIREHLWDKLLLAWVCDGDRDEVIRMLKEDKNISVHLQFGNKSIRVKGKNNSGSGTTTNLNTVVAAFGEYCTYRCAGYSPEEAWKMIGPKYGDDGLVGRFPKVASAFYEQVVSSLGLKIKVNESPPHSPMDFLGRVYPAPWRSPASMMKPSRCLPRIPIVASKDPLALRNRVCGYWVTECNTPLVREYLQAIARVRGFELSLTAVEVEMIKEKDMKWRIMNGAYPYDEEADAAAFRAIVCEDLKLTMFELLDRIKSLNEAKSDADIQAVWVRIPMDIPSVAMVQF